MDILLKVVLTSLVVWLPLFLVYLFSYVDSGCKTVKEFKNKNTITRFYGFVISTFVLIWFWGGLTYLILLIWGF